MKKELNEMKKHASIARELIASNLDKNIIDPFHLKELLVEALDHIASLNKIIDELENGNS